MTLERYRGYLDCENWVDFQYLSSTRQQVVGYWHELY